MVEWFKKVLIFILPLLFFSCLTIDAGIELREDFSGIFRYSSEITTLARDLELVDSSNAFVVFPLLDTNAISRANGIEGVRFVSPPEKTDDGSVTYVDGELQFDDLSSLSAFSGVEFLSEASGNNRVLTVTVYSVADEESITPRVLEIVRNSFSDDYIEIQIVIPGDIIRVQGAVFTGSTVTFRIGMAEMLESSEDVKFTVEFR